MKHIRLPALLLCLTLLLGGCKKTGEEAARLSFSASASIETLKALDGKQVRITGYMATLSPLDGSYIYLMNMPYQSCPFCVPNTAEFSFFLAIPVIFGASALKLVKYILYGQLTFSSLEISVLLSGCISAFIVSLITIRFLIEFVKKHSLIVFGIYRIILGIAVIAFSLIFGA